MQIFILCIASVVFITCQSLASPSVSRKDDIVTIASEASVLLVLLFSIGIKLRTDRMSQDGDNMKDASGEDWDAFGDLLVAVVVIATVSGLIDVISGSVF